MKKMKIANIKQILIAGILGFFAAVPLAFGASADGETEGSMRRFGIFIGSNNGGRDRSMLRYAVSDARAVSKVFSEMGGIVADDTVLLIEPTIREINSRMDALQEQVIRSRGSYKRTEVVFYYSGHSDEEGLLLNREKYSYRDLRNRIGAIPSDMRIVILDSCASGAFTRLKGGEKTQPFLVDSSLSAEGHAFLASSSADESSQESDRIGASYFTHSLVAGLRGAADSVGDGRVTLNELYRFAYSETLAQTETSVYGTQHPSYDIQVNGTGDLVLTDIRGTSASLAFDETLIGRLSIRDSSDFLIAEITKTAHRPMELGLEPGPYRITLQQGNNLLRADVTLIDGQRTLIAESDFRAIGAAPARPRGGEEQEISGGIHLYTFFFNVVSEPFRFPLIGFVNIAAGNHDTAQIGFVNWNTGNFSGVQASFVNTVGGNFNGLQAGLVNTTIGDTRGMQAGLLNTNIGVIKGMQLGLVNTAIGEVTGPQIGLLNISVKKLTGMQIGLVNYADSIEDGIPIGLLSIVCKGGYHAVEYGFSEFYPINAGLKLGVEKFYTSILWAYNPSGEFSRDQIAMGLGIGSILSINQFFFFNPELNFLNQNDNTNINYRSLVLSAGFRLGRFSVTAGPSFTIVNINDWFANHPDAVMPKPLFSLYSHDINKDNSIVIGARAAVQFRF